MRRKIYVTASDMLQLREQGLNNHDIAKSLDISYATVVRYIGKQAGHMESLEAFKDKPKKKEAETHEEVKIPEYEPKPVSERYEIGGVSVILDSNKQSIRIRMPYSGEVEISYKSVPDLVQFLVWAMRTRMEVTTDAEDQLKAEGCEV